MSMHEVYVEISHVYRLEVEAKSEEEAVRIAGDMPSTQVESEGKHRDTETSAWVD